MATVQSGIYSLGVTFFELLTGKLPFNDANAVNIAMKHISEPFPSVKKYRVDVDKRYDKIINKACSKEAKDRYRSMREFRGDLQKAMGIAKKKKPLFSFLFSKESK